MIPSETFRVCLLCAAAGLAWPGVALARLGETPAQLAIRFGPPYKVEQGTAYYRKNGVEVEAQGHGGICARITYRTEGLFSDEQAQHFLAVNQQPGQPWTQVPRTGREASPGLTAWDSPNRQFRAVYAGAEMSFSDLHLLRDRDRARAAHQAKATAGF